MPLEIILPRAKSKLVWCPAHWKKQFFQWAGHQTNINQNIDSIASCLVCKCMLKNVVSFIVFAAKCLIVRANNFAFGES